MKKAFSYLIAANFEAIAVLFGAWLAGDWLNENHPKEWNWMVVTFGFGILVIFHSWYVILRTLIRLDHETRNPPKGD